MIFVWIYVEGRVGRRSSLDSQNPFVAIVTEEGSPEDIWSETRLSFEM